MLSMLKEALEWLNRAEEAREVAGQLTDPGARKAVLELAESFDRLARAAATPAVFRRRELAVYGPTGFGRSQFEVQPGQFVADSPLERAGFEPGQFVADSPLERAGFELVWGSSCQVVVSGLWPVFCSEQESRSSSRRLRSGLRSARKGSRDRNASKLSGVPLSGACVWQRLEA